MSRLIRIARETDAEAVAAIYAPYVRDTAISFEVEPPDAVEMRARIASTLQTHPWLVCEDAAGVAGYAYASQHRTRPAYQWSADVSVYIDGRAHRKGFGRALYGALLDILRHQGFRNAYAGITLPNAASVGLHEALGFVPVAVYHKVGYKLGRWHDVGWWELSLQGYDESPLPPVPFSEIASEYR